MNITERLENSFEIYAGMTIQKRAIVDVRDCLKPSARLSIYSQYIDKLLPTKSYEKSSVSVASAMRHFYPYGDAGLYSMLARMGKPFAMRYILEDFQGSTGDITEDDNQAAMRYTNMRLSPLAMYLFQDIEKNTIEKWYPSYTDKEEYPEVLCSKGFYNICNGSIGIATGISASIPQFNLREVNEALIKLLWNQDIPIEEIICMPDFTTGCTILNQEEVKESLISGRGKACKLRATAQYLEDENCIIFTNTPYSVYTGTIVSQIVEIINGENNPGIEQIWDQSTNDAYIKIKLKKKSNPNRIIKYLYKNTSLQSHFSINLTMLDYGRFPRVFTWKEALQAYLDHEKSVYRRGFEFDLSKARARLHIVDGIIKAYDIIDEVIRSIKNSSSTATAKQNLIKDFGFSELQAAAILEIKLARLAHLEIEKYKKEREALLSTIDKLIAILSDNNLLYKEIENGLQEVINKFGDERRTKILNIEKEEEEEPVEEKKLIVYLTNKNSIYVKETSSLIAQARGGIGTKLNLSYDEVIMFSADLDNSNSIFAFTNFGRCFKFNLNKVPLNQKINSNEYLKLKDKEKIVYLSNRNNENDCFLFVTQNGLVKRVKYEELKDITSRGATTVKLKEDDSIVYIDIVNDSDKILIASTSGRLVIFLVNEIPIVGKIASGVIGINLEFNDKVASARKCSDLAGKELVTVTESGLIKSTELSEFPVTLRNRKGVFCHRIDEDDKLAAIAISDRTIKFVTVVASRSIIKIPISQIKKMDKLTKGTKSIKIKEEEKVEVIFCE